MNCPSWLLEIIFSYLCNRSLILTFLGASTEPQSLPGSSPQGTVLGVIIFLVKFNGACMRPKIPRNSLGPIQAAKTCSSKFMDDATVAVTVDLKKSLIGDPEERPKPLSYHEQNQLVLPDKQNLLTFYLNDLAKFSEENKMVINKSKTKIMTFNFSRKFNFPPEIRLPGNEPFEVVRKMKVLGVTISDSLKWHENTENMCTKARQRLWIILRLKNLKIDNQTLIDIFNKEIRSILEFACPVWNGSITKEDSAMIEKIQKSFLKIIVQKREIDYEAVCKVFKIQTLEERRLTLCQNFIKKEFKNNSGKFLTIKEQTKMVRKPNVVIEPQCKTEHYFISSVPYLSRMLNKMYRK